MSDLLAVNHLTMRFGGLTAIDDVSFAAKNKEITAIRLSPQLCKTRKMTNTESGELLAQGRHTKAILKGPAPPNSRL